MNGFLVTVCAMLAAIGVIIILYRAGSSMRSIMYMFSILIAIKGIKLIKYGLVTPLNSIDGIIDRVSLCLLAFFIIKGIDALFARKELQ